MAAEVDRRLRAIEDAAARIIKGCEWLQANLGHPDEARARRVIGGLTKWTRTAVLTAPPELASDPDFARLARLLFPCPRCKGRGTKFAGRCFKCGGSGHHAKRDK